MAKQLDLTKILDGINNLTTKEQLEAMEFIKGILDAKAADAEAELSMIKNNGK